ncbi:RNA polymerase sigma factor FliA [Luminiphilus sp.]|nr:RNA polymerase sigma factor FliA [Luminiphilus sp.]MDB2364993.1 RNA polymerase sigma factor FliA [Luminiphilus sp.]MDC0573768.1 RNA polymerase sigma factor FliA [Luminiphilus sp.]
MLKHIGLVHKTALHIKARLPDHVELEELIQIGMVGLLEAAKSYDSSQGADLGTFASKRIRGAILDEVRKRSPLSRTDSSHIKAETMVVEQFSAKYGRPPTASEIAHELDTTLDDYQRQRGRSQKFRTTSLDELDEAGQTPFSDEPGPQDEVEASETNEWLAEEIGGLPEREQIVLSLYYNDEMNLKEIGAIIGVSESRVSQILTKVVGKLRERIVF